VADAEAEAANKAEERAKVWKTHNGSNSTSPNTTPNTSVEIVPKDAQPSSISQIDQASSSQTALPDVADGEVSDASCQCSNRVLCHNLLPVLRWSAYALPCVECSGSLQTCLLLDRKAVCR